MYPATFEFVLALYATASDWYFDAAQNLWIELPVTPTTVTLRVWVDGVTVAEVTHTIFREEPDMHTFLRYTPNQTGPEFDITQHVPANARRVLLSNTRVDAATGAPSYPYPFYQRSFASAQKDKAIPVNLRTYVNGVATPGVDLTLQVIDPPDPSEYIVGVPGGQPAPGSALSHPGDNMEATLPTLTGTGVALGSTPGTYTVTSGANGFVSTTMQLPAGARAGDNYQVVATMTGTPATSTSGTITAWKRMFVEKQRMFRLGNPIVTDAPAGVWHIVVPDTQIGVEWNAQANPPGFAAVLFAPGDSVVLLHAPPYGQAKSASSFYSSYSQIAASAPFPSAVQLTSTGTGTVTTTQGSATITGTRTRFRSQLTAESATSVGSVINIANRRLVVMAIGNDKTLTVHTPVQFSGNNLPYTIGDAQLAPSTQYVRLTLTSPLTNSYQREPLSSTSDSTLNDGVVKISAPGSIRVSDYFDMSDSLLVGGAEEQPTHVFPSAFNEYIVLPPSPVPLPHVIFPSGTGSDPKIGHWYVDKWFRLPTGSLLQPLSPASFTSYGWSVPGNHQLMLVGDSFSTLAPRAKAGDTPLLAVSYPSGPPNPENQVFSILFRGGVEQAVQNQNNATYQQNVDWVLPKIQVHELVHQWTLIGWPTDANRLDHCYPNVAYDSPSSYPVAGGTTAPGTLFCMMSAPVASPNANPPDLIPTMPAPWNPSIPINRILWEYGNGITKLHMVQRNNVWSSEYLDMRRTDDPWRP